MNVASHFYDGEMGRPSEDPIMLLKLMVLSFYFNVQGDENTLHTLKYRIDWRQFCGLSLFEVLPDRTTLVKFRGRVGPTIVDALFEGLVERLKSRGLLDQQHRFFDGTPAKARACINPYRDEMYEKPLVELAAETAQNPPGSVELTPDIHPSPVHLSKTTYPVESSAVGSRRAEPMKPVADRQSAGDSDARFQRSKHGKAGP